MNTKDYWDKKHLKYLAEDWINKPSLFAQWAIQYFPAGSRVLELGAGQGQDSRYFNEVGFQVVSTDFSEKGQELAKEKTSSDITFEHVDLSEPLPFEDGSFDVVYSHLALHYFDEEATERLFAEIKRVLKDSGILAALFNSTTDPEVSDGKAIETDFYELGGIYKRFFSPESAKRFAQNLTVIVADTEGTTYKDEAVGVTDLIRLVARKD